MNLDIANGHCVNATIKQNLTYGEQGLPLGVNLGNGKKSAGNQLAGASMWAFAATLGAMMWGLGLGL